VEKLWYSDDRSVGYWSCDVGVSDDGRSVVGVSESRSGRKLKLGFRKSDVHGSRICTILQCRQRYVSYVYPSITPQNQAKIHSCGAK